MDKKNNNLFNCKHFENNCGLQKTIDESENRGFELADESLERVSAAGDVRLEGETQQEEESGKSSTVTGLPKPEYSSELPEFGAPRKEWNL